MLKLGLETESLHLWLQHKRMDIFGFIEKAHELGLDGVQTCALPISEKVVSLVSQGVKYVQKCSLIIKYC